MHQADLRYVNMCATRFFEQAKVSTIVSIFHNVSLSHSCSSHNALLQLTSLSGPSSALLFWPSFFFICALELALRSTLFFIINLFLHYLFLLF